MISEQKQTLRRCIVQRFAGFPPLERAAASAQIARHVRAIVQDLGVGPLLGFHPLATEPVWWIPPDHPIAAAAFPVLDGETLRFYAVSRLEDLVTGPLGSREPDPRTSREVSSAEAKAILVPGRAFDRSGYRLGRGGGWYDRVLAELSTDCLRIGLAFEMQWVEEVPVERHDLPVDCIVTEKGVHRVDPSGV